jgi:hypothetical protein
MTTSLVLEKVTFLRGVLDPNTVDGNPGQPGPIYRNAIANYIVAEILRDISSNIKDKTLATQIHTIGKELVTESSKGLVAGWEDGDDICPPYLNFPIPKPGPGPDPWQQFLQLTAHPEPFLDQATPAVHDVVLAIAIRELASLTTNEKASAALKQVGETIVKGASTRIFDEYCGTRVKPRIPAPTPHRTAA